MYPMQSLFRMECVSNYPSLIAVREGNLGLFVNAQEDASTDRNPHDTGSNTREQGPWAFLRQNPLESGDNSRVVSRVGHPSGANSGIPLTQHETRLDHIQRCGNTGRNTSRNGSTDGSLPGVHLLSLGRLSIGLLHVLVQWELDARKGNL